jgi:hypothetical protein
MEQDWDNLFILDACRADIFEEVIDISSFDKYSREISRGSHSSEWMERNFGDQDFGDTVYVTGNPHTKLIVEDSFHDIIEVRREAHDHGPQPMPSEMIDATLNAHETYPDKRLIVHFMQPHSPLALRGDLQIDDLSRPEWLKLYKESLEKVLAEARDLHNCIDGKTVISADHGETHNRRLFSLFKIQNHPPNVRLPELVEVPWATLAGERRKITAGQTRTLEPDDDVEQRLEQLGYKAK